VKLTPSITLLPLLHGKAPFAAHVRALCAKDRFDCFVIDLPAVFQNEIGPAVDNLPFVSAIVARDFAGSACRYVPIDPCDAVIEGIRQARQDRAPFYCIGKELVTRPLPPLPDAHAIDAIGFDIYAALCLQALGNPEAGSDEDAGARCIAGRLRELATSFKNILALVHFRHYARTVYHFGNTTAATEPPGQRSDYHLQTYYVNPDHLYFALGELPYITGKFERERHDLFAAPFDVVTEIKNLFRETRDDIPEDNERKQELSPVRIQTALTFLRNLTVMSGGLLPSLFDIVEAGKGVGGNAYALRLLNNARYYPYLPFELNIPLLGVGIGHVSLPGTGDALPAVNLFRDTEMEWRTISIRHDPSLERKKKYRYAWDPAGMCSHVPEDGSIERFNAHVRAKSLKVLVEELHRTEKFTASVKDGIDIRETLRNWHTGSIYVREAPPVRGRIDTVVIVFDDAHDDRYPHQATWYAEHGQESTLTFYATDPFDDLIGPGIARCRYGGLSLLFPPRPVPDIFALTAMAGIGNLAARLTYGALLFSKETNVGYVSEKRPGAAVRLLASKLKKRLVWISMASFSRETLGKLKKFHILNGKDVRSWAARFIGED
jgi:hypothetical protein